MVLLQGPTGGHHLAFVLLVVEAHRPLDLGLPLGGRGAAPGLFGGTLGGGRGRACQAGGEVCVGPAEGGCVCVDPGLLLLGGGHFQKADQGCLWLLQLLPSYGDSRGGVGWLGESCSCW